MLRFPQRNPPWLKYKVRITVPENRCLVKFKRNSTNLRYDLWSIPLHLSLKSSSLVYRQGIMSGYVP